MCRIMYIPRPQNMGKHESLIKLLARWLEYEKGGDGNGIGGFEKGYGRVYKNNKLPVDDIIDSLLATSWDHGVLFHTRYSSMGPVTTENCHPFLKCSDKLHESITCHNGTIPSIPALKMVLLKDRSIKSLDSIEELVNMTDSEIISEYIDMYGFEIAEMFSKSVILTMWDDTTKVFVDGDFELMEINGDQIYASRFPEEIGMISDRWFRFMPGSILELGEFNPLFYKGTAMDLIKGIEVDRI